MMDCIGLYELDMQAYFKQEWVKALSFFNQSLSHQPHTLNPSQIFIKRCELMKAKPPGDDWDGVFVMKSK